MRHMSTINASCTSAPLHESWARAGLMHAQYGVDALPHVLREADRDAETAPIWRGIAECLSACPRR
jgi:hypothetical protein